MTLRLAHDPIELSHGDLTVRLRPSLRAGLLIAQRFSVDRLRDVLGQIHLGELVYLISLGTDDHDDAIDIVTSKTEDDGVLSLTAFTPEITTFIALSMGISSGTDDDQSQADTTDAPDFAKTLEDLYEVGTGWLGWTPADTWAATPAEIIAARNGLFAKLKAIHGSGEDDADSAAPAPIPTEEQVRSNLADLKAMTGGKF